FSHEAEGHVAAGEDHLFDESPGTTGGAVDLLFDDFGAEDGHTALTTMPRRATGRRAQPYRRLGDRPELTSPGISLWFAPPQRGIQEWSASVSPVPARKRPPSTASSSPTSGRRAVAVSSRRSV